MIINILILVFGLLILVKGADWLVDGASALAKKHHISDLAIGLTIVAFVTSARVSCKTCLPQQITFLQLYLAI